MFNVNHLRFKSCTRNHARMTQGNLTGLVNKYRTARIKARTKNTKAQFCLETRLHCASCCVKQKYIEKQSKNTSFFQERDVHEFGLFFGQKTSFFPPRFFPGRATGEAGRCRAPGEEIFRGSFTRSYPEMHTSRRVHGKGGARQGAGFRFPQNLEILKMQPEASEKLDCIGEIDST